jgi:hypothetical protein
VFSYRLHFLIQLQTVHLHTSYLYYCTYCTLPLWYR